MSVSIGYRFEIKSKNPQTTLEKLFEKTYPKINFNYLKKMPTNIKDETNYDNWATDTFGISYKWDIDHAYIEDNKAIISIEGNKTSFSLEPWFNKFKEDLEVYIFSEYDYFESPIDDYTHIIFKNNEILSLQHSDEIGLEFKHILELNDKIKLIDYLMKEFDMPEEFVNDDIKDIIIRFISIYPILYKYLTDDYKNNTDFIDEVLNKNDNLYKYLDEQLKENRSIIIATLKSKHDFNNNESEAVYRYIHEVIRKKYSDDMELLELLIKKEPDFFRVYIDKFKDNKEVALSALGINYNSSGLFELLSDRLKNDIDIAKKCCQYEPYYDKEFREIYSDNKEIALYALDYANESNRSYECVLEKFSERLKNDRDVVMKSLEKEPLSFRFVGDSFKKNHDICLKAINANGENISYIDKELLNDYEFCIELIKLLRKNKSSFHVGWRRILQNLKNEEILNDKKIVLEAIDHGAILWSPNDIFERYLKDEDIMVRALIKDDYLYEHLPEEYRDNEVYTIAALTNKISDKELKRISSTTEFVKNICRGTVYQGIISNAMNPSFFRKAGNNLQYASDRLKNKKNVVLYAISQTPSAFYYASSELKEDREILKAIYNSNDFNDKTYALSELKEDREILKVIYNSNDFNAKTTAELIKGLIIRHPELYNCYSEKYRSDYDLTIKVIETYENFNYTFDLKVPFDKFSHEQLIEVYKKIISKWRNYYKELPEEYKNDESIVMEAIKAYGNNLQYTPDKYRTDEKLINLSRNQMKKYNMYEKFYLDENSTDTNQDDDPFADFGAKIEVSDSELPF